MRWNAESGNTEGKVGKVTKDIRVIMKFKVELLESTSSDIEPPSFFVEMKD